MARALAICLGGAALLLWPALVGDRSSLGFDHRDPRVDLRPWVEAVTVGGVDGSDARVALGLDLIGSAEVALGSGDFVADKLTAVRTVLERVDLTCLDVIDVAVADSPVTTRDEACEGGAVDEEVDDGA